MFYNTDIELEEEVLVEEKKEDSKKLYVHNDDVHSFEFVIICLMNVCGHSPTQAEQCSLIIHHRGKCAVKENLSEGKLKLMQKQLQTNGLSATVE